MTDTLYAQDAAAAQRETREHYARLSDAADLAEHRSRLAERADLKTRPARQAIQAIAANLNEQEAAALVSCLIAAMGQSICLHGSDMAANAVQALADAHSFLEG